jgi:hypothetical protein
MTAMGPHISRTSPARFRCAGRVVERLEGYPGMHSPAVKDWIASRQIPAEAWYVASPNLTVAETKAREARCGGRGAPRQDSIAAAGVFAGVRAPGNQTHKGRAHCRPPRDLSPKAFRRRPEARIARDPGDGTEAKTGAVLRQSRAPARR